MRKLIIASMLLLVITNIVVLVGVAYNKSGDVFASVELTERELPIRFSYADYDEDSSTTLSLSWQVLTNNEETSLVTRNYYSEPVWLDADKLIELGFNQSDIDKNSADFRDKIYRMRADVVLVFEYNGTAYKQDVVNTERALIKLRNNAENSQGDQALAESLKRQEEMFNKLKIANSRLYVIDAGFDQALLAEKYSDKSKYLFLRGEIGLRRNNDKVTGRIQKVYIKNIHVPLPYSSQLTNITKGEKYLAYGKEVKQPRYLARLNIGKRLEPWVESVEVRVSK